MSHPRKDLEIFGKIMIVSISEKVGQVYTGRCGGRTIYIAGMEPNAVGSFPCRCCAAVERRGNLIPIVVPNAKYGTPLCYECNLIHALGDLYEENVDILYAKFEKTCGAVMFTEKDGQRRYLLIKNESGHIGFPKGHIEYGESETETAEREVFEETALIFSRYGDFREEYTFTTRENSVKTGVFFIGHYNYREPEIQQEEILDDWLLSYADALRLLNFPEDRDLLKKAEKYISERENNVT